MKAGARPEVGTVFRVLRALVIRLKTVPIDDDNAR